jgi:hypothetical protein
MCIPSFILVRLAEARVVKDKHMIQVCHREFEKNRTE